ncbi:MAG: hypothetical protein IT444_00795 [Phycisphaeraceae bacterium]|nr:hypothetical protein [Phycisphaeraceae bacterium]
MSSPDYILDIQGLKPPAPAEATPAPMRGRPWLAVKWRCCATYSRIYRNADGSAYEGRCPKCGTPVRARVGPGGTDHRFFEAG